jgi:hypothetical protein
LNSDCRGYFQALRHDFLQLCFRNRRLHLGLQLMLLSFSSPTRISVRGQKDRRRSQGRRGESLLVFFFLSSFVRFPACVPFGPHGIARCWCCASPGLASRLFHFWV